MNKKLILLSAALLGTGLVQIASALPAAAGLYLVDTATGETAFVPDNTNGIAYFNAPLGDFADINATGTLSIGGSTPSMDLDVAAAIAGAGATTFQVYFSAGVFGPTDTTYTLATTGPTYGSPISSAYTGGSYFDTTTTLASSADFYPYTLNGTGTLNSSSYYLTLEDLISNSTGGMDTRMTVTVPEPSAWALLLMGLALPGAALLRKKLAA